MSLAKHRKNTYRRRQGFHQNVRSVLAQDNAENPYGVASLTGFEQRSENYDLKREPNHVYDRVCDKADSSNR